MASMFAHRHYEAIAEIIGDVDYSVSKGEVTDAQAYEVMVRALELLFAEDNPKFNLVRFHNACGKVGK